MSRCSQIYIIGLEEGPVKIGMSSNPNKRLHSVKNFAKAAGAKLLWCQEHDAADKIEGLSHFYLCCYEAGNEWFFIPFKEALKAVKRIMRLVDSGKYIGNKVLPYNSELEERSRRSYATCNKHYFHFFGNRPKVKAFVDMFLLARKSLSRKDKNQVLKWHKTWRYMGYDQRI